MKQVKEGMHTITVACLSVTSVLVPQLFFIIIIVPQSVVNAASLNKQRT
jgi:hypothetical protein